MRSSYWSSDLCSSDLLNRQCEFPHENGVRTRSACHVARGSHAQRPSFDRSLSGHRSRGPADLGEQGGRRSAVSCHVATSDTLGQNAVIKQSDAPLSVEFSRLGNWRWCLSWLIVQWVVRQRSEEHTSELQSLMRNSNAV